MERQLKSKKESDKSSECDGQRTSVYYKTERYPNKKISAVLYLEAENA